MKRTVNDTSTARRAVALVTMSTGLTLTLNGSWQLLRDFRMEDTRNGLHSTEPGQKSRVTYNQISELKKDAKRFGVTVKSIVWKVEERTRTSVIEEHSKSDFYSKWEAGDE